jgi:hypothetical protein
VCVGTEVPQEIIYIQARYQYQYPVLVLVLVLVRMTNTTANDKARIYYCRAREYKYHKTTRRFRISFDEFMKLTLTVESKNCPCHGSRYFEILIPEYIIRPDTRPTDKKIHAHRSNQPSFVYICIYI